ncbi:MAG: helix-turn-helix domain-containing protein [Gammaproteobacteria bacterium]
MMRRLTRAAMRARGIAGLLCIVFAPLSAPAFSGVAAPEVLTLAEAARLLRIDPGELARFAERDIVPGRRLGTQWRFSRAALLAWLAGETERTNAGDQNTARADASGSLHAPAVAPAQEQTAADKALEAGELIVTSGRGGADSAPRSPGRKATQAPDTIGEKPDLRTSEEVFLRDQLLLEPRTLTLELGLSYARNDQRDFVFAIPPPGAPLPAREQEIDSFTTIFTARYGLPGGYQLFSSLPISYQESATFFAGNQQIDSGSRTDLRALNLGVRRTVMREAAGRPEVILSADGAVPTGDSSWGVGGSVALVKTVDPVFLFGNLGYRHTFSRDFDDLLLLESEDTFTTSFGYGLRLNDTLSISTAFSGRFTGDTEFDRVTLRSREQYSLRFGLTSILTKNLSVEPSVSFNLAGTSPNVTVGINLPYTFQP